MSEIETPDIDKLFVQFNINCKGININCKGIAVKPDKSLIFVTKILSLTPIAGYDRVLLARINGWDATVNISDNFKVGDLVLYYSLDTIPDSTKGCPTDFLEGKPITSRKFKKVISSGLIGPLKWLEYYNIDLSTVTEEMDLTNLIPCSKFVEDEEKDQYINNTKNIEFPSNIPKTDLVNIRTNKLILNISKNNNFNISIRLKYDGTSATAFLSNNELILYSRNYRLLTEDASNIHYFEMSKKYNLLDVLKDNINFVLQYEIIGPKINKNMHNLTENEIRLFKIFNTETNRYLQRNELLNFSEKYNIKLAIEVYYGIVLDEWVSNISNLIKFVNSLKDEYGNKAEGGVMVLNNDNYTYLDAKILSDDFKFYKLKK
jgi:hypothetical protein